jgi:CRISPR/Cas system-associated exonuclease Cas4 (RecB family)
VVFPSRRAGLYFKDNLSKRINKLSKLPEVYSIEDFLLKISGYKLADKLALIFGLYEIMKPYLEGESFDRFYAWGEMLIGDFNDIDNNLVNGKYLFRIIHEFREIDEEFKLSLADEEAFRKFWEIFSARELDQYSNSFLKMWEKMGVVYGKFRKSLDKTGLAYEGMANRKAYQLIKSGKADVKWKKVIFAGLNLLTKAESGIIKELLKDNKAEIFWDADEHYINDAKQEAGYYIRKNFAELSIHQPAWIENNLLNKPKQIISIGAPLTAGQAKTLGSILNELIGSEKLTPEKTVVVLPDEKMLVPVLYSIPNEVSELNVTMGFPFRYSGLFNFAELLRRLQKNKRSGEKTLFYYKDVINLLLHSYTELCTEEDVNKIIGDIKQKNQVHVSDEIFIDKDGLPGLIFKDVQTVNDTAAYISSAVKCIAKKLESGNAPRAKFEMEFFKRFLEELDSLTKVLNEYISDTDTVTFWKLLHEVTAGMKVPFSGEPLKGLQVMGLLETRALDFENVFILSMNEGIIPKGSQEPSFIPYNLRKAFSLPTYEDGDTITSYYFYRLLQRAKNIYLIYNSEVNVLSAGERSRYILQIENELKQLNPQSKTALMPVVKKPDTEIKIEKSEEALQKLSERTYISPSALNIYINCTLQFYFKYIAGLEEPEDVEEFFEAGTFGDIIHTLLGNLYENSKGKVITPEDISEMIKYFRKDYDKLLDNALDFSDELKRHNKSFEGKNLLFKGVIKKLVEKVLEKDSTRTPFKLVEIEEEYLKELTISSGCEKLKVTLGGRIDRIEEQDSIIRIIDYKTGRVQKDIGSLSEKVIDSLFTNPGYKEYFQILTYLYLYKENTKTADVQTGIYPLRTLGNSEINFINVSAGELAEFEKRFMLMLEELFNPAIPFTQTEEENRCKYCPYQKICYREQEI